MRRVLVLLLVGCSSSNAPTPDPSPTPAEPPPTPVSTMESEPATPEVEPTAAERVAPAEPLPPPTPTESFMTALNDLLLELETIDEQIQWRARTDAREAYGDGDDCDGVCGLILPDPGEKPQLSDPLTLEEVFGQMLQSSADFEGANWEQLREELSGCRDTVRAADEDASESALSEISRAAVERADAAIRRAMQESGSDALFCLVGLSLAAFDGAHVESVLRRASEQESLRQQIDEAEGIEVDDDANNRSAFLHAEEHAPEWVDAVNEATEQRPTNLPRVFTALSELRTGVQDALSARELAQLDATRAALSRLCAARPSDSVEPAGAPSTPIAAE